MAGSSPYKDTRTTGFHLGYFKIRPVPSSPDDPLYEIQSQYTHRPDLLSYDLYDTPKLWWVFAQRNMNVIRDPIYDFIPGVKIYLPNKERLLEAMGG